VTTVASPPRPYKGLAPFDDAPVDALFFFGREREREIIVANLLASRLTVLYGPTGVGKSSLLRAGVAPQIRALPDATVAIVSEWSEDPTAAIDEVVARTPGDVFLVLDQIEEYFVYHDQNGPFGRRLPELVQESGLRVNVLLGVREDALAKLDLFKSTIPNVLANYLRLDHLDRAAARAAIVRPLERLNDVAPVDEPYAAEPELVEAVLDQVAAGRIEYGLSGRGVVAGRDEPARVEAPFLQLVLERLWDTEQTAGSRVLRLETLEFLGGAETVVRRHLEHALGALEDDQRALAAEMFGHLVTPSGTKIAHDVDDLARYAAAGEPAVADVLARLARERIVRPVGGGRHGSRYEIFHDVLAEGVLAWRTQFEAEVELARERKRRRRAIAVAGAALLALAAVAAIALFALAQRERAQDRATTARARERAARALTLLAVDPQRSLSLAVAAASDERTQQIEDVLRASLLAARQRRVLPAVPDASVVAIAPGGRVIVQHRDQLRSYAQNGSAHVVLAPIRGRLLALSRDRALTASAEGRELVVSETTTGRDVVRLELQGALRTATFDETARRLAVVAANRAGREYASVFRLPDGVRTHLFRERGSRSVAFSLDGRLLAVGGADDAARVWRLADGKLIETFDEHSGDVLAVAFSPDGELLATGSADSGVRVWRVATGERRFLFVGHNNPTVALAWSPDGRFLADGSLDRTSRILDIGGIGSGRLAGVLIGHEAGISGVAYSPDGRRLATVSLDGTARVWDARAEHEALVAATHVPGPTRASFDPTGRWAVSAGMDGAVLIDVARRRELARFGAPSPVVVARFDAAGERIVTGGPWGAAVHDVGERRSKVLPLDMGVADAVFDRSRIVIAGTDGWARVFDGAGRMIAHLDHGLPVSRVAVRADGLVATAATDGSLRLWRRGRAASLVSGHIGVVNALRFSEDATRLLSAGDDGAVRIWDADSGALLVELAGHVGGATDGVFDPAGGTVVTTDRARHVRAWDAADGRLLRDLIGHFSAVNSASFSRDGRWLVTTSSLAAALWQSHAEEPFTYIRGHTSPVVRTAEFSPDGRSVLTAADDGTVRLYRCEICGGVDRLVELARRRLVAARPVR
jgi:WD40 repeat protein